VKEEQKQKRIGAIKGQEKHSNGRQAKSDQWNAAQFMMNNCQLLRFASKSHVGLSELHFSSGYS
jgi:hypothetical protein